MLFHSGGNHYQNKRQPTEQEKVFVNHISNKRWAKWMKGLNGTVMGGNKTSGNDHCIVYIDVKL